MFTPKYEITNRLLANIKRINTLVNELNNQELPSIIRLSLEKDARTISSFASTSIEGNPLPLTEVKKILKSKPKNTRDSEKEVLNYNTALIALNSLLKKKELLLSFELILKIQKQVTKELLPSYESGYIRKKPVVISDPRTRKTVYLPPDEQDVKVMVEDLLEYVERSKKTTDPLILAGIFHKQLVIIHPFMDGNGRTTRLATKVLLAQMRLNTFNLFSFENYYNNNVTNYFKIVGEYGNYYEIKNKITFTAWLEYFTEGIIDELLRVQKHLKVVPTNPADKPKPYHKKLISYIKKNGHITDKEYSLLVDRAKATRALDFNKLIQMGLLIRKGKGRATYYVLR